MKWLDVRVRVKRLKIFQLNFVDANLIKSNEKPIPTTKSTFQDFSYKCKGFFPLTPQIPKSITSKKFTKENYPEKVTYVIPDHPKTTLSVFD